MTKDELQQSIVEAGDKLYSDKNSPVYFYASELIAEIINITEKIMLEVLYSMEEVRNAEEKTKEKDE